MHETIAKPPNGAMAQQPLRGTTLGAGSLKVTRNDHKCYRLKLNTSLLAFRDRPEKMNSDENPVLEERRTQNKTLQWHLRFGVRIHVPYI